MSKKKKLSKQLRIERRLKEAQKAESATLYRPQDVKTNSSSNVSTSPVSTASLPKSEKYSLPIAEIKHDLWKNLFYAGFSIVLVVVLKIFLKL